MRSRISNVLKECLDVLPGEQRRSFVSFLVQLCRSKVPSHRIFDVELLGEVILKEWAWNESNTVNLSIEGDNIIDAHKLNGTDDLTSSSFPTHLLSDLVLSTLNGRSHL